MRIVTRECTMGDVIVIMALLGGSLIIFFYFFIFVLSNSLGIRHSL